jgi:Tfp pilus assembly protein PilN
VIRINLAARKQFGVVAGGREGAAAVAALGERFAALKAFDLRGLGLDALSSLPLRQLGTAIAAVAVAYTVAEGMKRDEVGKVMKEIEGERAAQVKLKADFERTKGYEPLKKQLDADEKTMRVKLETIQKLVADREVPPKLLIALAKGIPAEVWLSEFSADAKDVKMKGFSVGYDQISDFMRMLGESIYLTELQLVGSQQAKDAEGFLVQAFELAARRR